jgi:alkanesulfonate monooxygenase SsuD/methylene tetrahydromethanopterin reductase-like flavin-dependent oxidoreductase (luciferase family)
MTTTPRVLLILSENWTLAGPRDLKTLIRWAQEAEDAGVDGIMLSEHIVLGGSAGANGIMGNPRDYAMPGNQDPYMPWPNSLALMSAIAAVTSRLRLVGAAVITPLRHPLMIAREYGTLDIISEGRLVIQPTVSWHEDEYRALGVPFNKRGKILDEQLAALANIWAGSPAEFHGEFYDFEDVYLEPKAWRPDGVRMWFGGQKLAGPVLERLLKYGHGWHPIGAPKPDEVELLASALAEQGRSLSDIDMVGGARAAFPDDDSVAEIGPALDSVPDQMAMGFTTICVKPSMFIDDPGLMSTFCRDLVRRMQAI